MSVLNGTMYVTSDYNIAAHAAMNGSIVVSISDINSHEHASFLKEVEAVEASVLLPPYVAMEPMLDGDLNTFNQIYWEYLSSEIPSSYIMLFVRALYGNTNIMIYVTKDEAELPYIPSFMQYMRFTFGIIIGTESSHYQLDPTFGVYEGILLLLYANDMITLTEFIEVYPKETFILDNMTRMIALKYGRDRRITGTEDELIKALLKDINPPSLVVPFKIIK